MSTVELPKHHKNKHKMIMKLNISAFHNILNVHHQKAKSSQYFK